MNKIANPQLLLFVPTYNCFKYTKELYETTKCRKRFLWYFMDNASKDETQNWLTEIGKEDNVIASLHAVNQGCAASWNCGLNFGFNELKINAIAFLNNDTILNKDCLDIMYDVIIKEKYNFVTATNRSADISNPLDIIDFKVPEKEEFTETPDFSCFMMNKFAYSMIGKFDDKFYPAYFEDNDYHYRGRLVGNRLMKLNRALFFHYGSRTLKENPDIEKKVSETYLNNQDYFVQKWGGLPGEEKYLKPFNKEKKEVE